MFVLKTDFPLFLDGVTCAKFTPPEGGLHELVAKSTPGAL